MYIIMSLNVGIDIAKLIEVQKLIDSSIKESKILYRIFTKYCSENKNYEGGSI